MAKLPKKSKNQKERALELYNELLEYYPDPRCELDHRNPFELLIATILSAQCTDVRVNKVTPDLFEAYPTPETMAGQILKISKNWFGQPVFTEIKPNLLKNHPTLLLMNLTEKSPKG